MSLHVINSDKRLVPQKSKCFCEVHPDPKCRLKPGTCSDCDCIDLRRFALFQKLEQRSGKTSFSLKQNCDGFPFLFGNNLLALVYKFSLFESCRKQGNKVLRMLPFGEHWVHAAVFLVYCNLREKCIAKHLELSFFPCLLSFDDRNCSLIARGFNRENPHGL